MKMMKNLMLLAALLLFAACTGQVKQQEKPAATTTETPATTQKEGFTVNKTDAEWKKELTPQQYEVLRNKGTERAFTGQYYNHFEKGVYVCAACGNQLFTSNAKFNSDCGWPSFDQAIEGSVTYHEDNSFGMQRTEVMCAKCGGHLGHVFDDGPKETTGDRFCTNSVSIKFVPAKK